MTALRVALLVTALAAPAPAWAELSLAFRDGRVTLKATDVPLRQVLQEWARLGQTRIAGLEKLGGGPVTLELTDVPEKQALEILLRSVAGYVAAPRPGVPTVSQSRFDRLALLPTSHAAAAPAASPRPAAFTPPPPMTFPDPTQLANGDQDGDPPATPQGIPIYSPNLEPPPPGPAVPAGPGNGLMPGQMRPPGPDDVNQQAPAGPMPGVTTPLVTPRPGVIPVPPPQPRP